WQFLFTGGQNAYQVFDSRGFVNTTLPFTDDGIHIDFTLTGTNSYTANIVEAEGPVQTVSGTLASSGTVGQFAFFDHNAGFNNTNNTYANNLAIVPEPSTISILLLGTGIILASVSRRRFLRF